MAGNPRPLTHDDYTVAIICPMGVELAPVEAMLDKIHQSLPTSRDKNSYTLGRMGAHNVVIAIMPEIGNNSAAIVAIQLLNDFTSIRFGLLVGIGGGIPGNDEDDIRLGDVVVSKPTATFGGVVQFDRGKVLPNGQFERTGTLKKPPAVLMANVQRLEAQHRRIGNQISKYLSEMLERFPDMKEEYVYQGMDHDQLFEAAYNHMGGKTCRLCDQSRVVERSPPRKSGPRIHYGTIGSANEVIKDSETRDKLRKDLGILCVEMEAAGLMDEFSCLVIRGICDYTDSHKNKRWQPYAAATAAAYAKELLSIIPAPEIATTTKVADALQRPTDKLNTLWLVPFERNPHFVGRDAHIKELEEKLSPADICRRVAIFGLGGVGKTQIALEFAHRLRKRSPNCAVFWVPAITTASFEQAYLEIATLLQIPGIAEEKADVKRLVQNRLNDENSGEWFLIIDNADDIDVLFQAPIENSNSPRLIDYLPSSPKRSILFTTRTRKAAMKYANTDVIEVLKMDQIEAKEVLEKSLFRKHLLNEDEAVIQLLELLTYLPLAIVQAVSYINENYISISGYVALYKTGSEKDIIEVLSEDFEDRGRYQNTENSIATTWLISFEQIRRQDLLAAEYLSFMACLIQESIPQSLLPPGESMNKEIKAIGTLTAYSFITKRETEQSFDLHRLVHLATRNWLRTTKSLAAWTEITFSRLADVFPSGDHKNRAIWTAYLPHARHVLTLPHSSDRNEEAEIELLFKVGWCLQSNGQYMEAEQMHRQTLELREQVLGPEHRDTLTSMNQLGSALSSQGKYTEAEQMHRQTLELREKVLGPEHPDTLTSMNQLGSALSSQGKYTEAEQMHRQTLELDKKVSGPEHPDTLTSMNQLASALSSQGKYTEAEQMHRQTLELRGKVSGPEHPHTLTSMNQLASALSSQGKYTEAEQMHRQTLELREKMLGPKHPDTLTSMSQLASALSSQGKYTEAEQMHRQTLELREKVSGPEHPHTLTSMNQLASALSSQGKYTEAEQMHRQTLELREKVLGPEHPHTLTSMNQLGSALSSQGKYTEAEQMHRQTLELRKKVSGPEHPHTLTSMNELASALSSQGKYTEAEQMHRQTLELREKVSGPEHPDTLTSVWWLAYLLQGQGQYNDSTIFYQRAYAGFQKILGSDHPTTLSCSKQYASMLKDMKRAEDSGDKRTKIVVL